MIMAFLHYVCVSIVTFWGLADCVNLTAHQELLKKVQSSQYDASIRPNVDGQAVLVEVDMVLISIGPVSVMDMTWTSSFYLRQEWTDPRLILPGANTIIKLAKEHIDLVWKPDLFFSNSRGGTEHKITVPNHLVYLNSSTGQILSSQRLTLVFNCEMDLVKFPHDNQTCLLKMESYSYNTNDLKLLWSSKRAATSLMPTVYLPDFHIENISTEDCSATYAIGTYPCLCATVRFKRQIGFYIFETYLPSILIVILSWASFWIDHEAVPARISVGLLTVLTITTQLSGSRSQLPRVPYIKAIDVWMSINLVFVFAAYMEYAVVTVLSRGYKKAVMRKAPQTNAMDTAGTEQQQVETPTTSKMSIDSETEPKIFRQMAARRLSVPFVASPSMDNDDTGRRVDKTSRFFFPVVYALFNVVYWAFYLTVD